MKFYSTLIKPLAKDPDTQNRELVLNYILLGTILLAIAAFIESIVSYAVRPYPEIVSSCSTIVVFVSLLIYLYWLERKRRQLYIASYALTLLFLVIASFVVSQWGLHLPAGILLFGFIIVMAGILLGARYSIYTLFATMAIMSGLQAAIGAGLIKPDTSWRLNSSNAGDLSGYFILFAIIALVCWLFNGQMERSLRRAQRSEAALKRQKLLLEVKVEDRTRELEASQLERLQQIYRFAELGRVSSALFHDLANHLTSVSLDVEGLKTSNSRELTRRIQHNIHYIDEVVQRVRTQMRGKAVHERFDVIYEVEEVIKILSYKANENHATIKLERPDDDIFITGDTTRFRQIIINLLSNAVDAYVGSRKTEKLVIVDVGQMKNMLQIRVTDWGKGFPEDESQQIFEPFFTRKQDGTGIGLFIVKQIVEQDFHGDISVRSNRKTGTEFVINLPLK